MKVSYRVSTAEMQFYIQSLVEKGFVKYSTTHYKWGSVTELNKTIKGKSVKLTVRYTTNGWMTIS